MGNSATCNQPDAFTNGRSLELGLTVKSTEVEYWTFIPSGFHHDILLKILVLTFLTVFAT